MLVLAVLGSLALFSRATQFFVALPLIFLEDNLLFSSRRFDY